ncbi:DUF1198 family protein, partial [Salmonella enterica subsp. enterica serovar Montevideo]|nr:DUF1198 family protein [Salmonella enterica subsp. enterica serovar Montevideo]
LFRTLWAGKFWIIGIGLLFALIALAYTFFARQEWSATAITDRRAIRRLSERLNIDVVPIESMIDQMGKTAGGEFLQYLHRPDE